MKDKLDPQSRKALVQYRLERAYETLREADYVADGKHFVMAMNRLYYAAYYAASALMLHNQLECATHSGIRRMLSLHFVLPGKLDSCFGKTFAILFDNRQAGDYDDFVFSDQESFDTYRPRAEEFVNEMKRLINKPSD